MRNAAGRGDLRRQGGEPAQPRALLLRLAAEHGGEDARALARPSPTSSTSSRTPSRRRCTSKRTLVKRHQPFFNIRLKDDKHYPYLKVDLADPWPRVYITRRVEKDGARYFGPYANAGSVRRTLDIVNKLFPWRSCTKTITGTDPRPCLDYYINRCIAPCTSLLHEGGVRRGHPPGDPLPRRAHRRGRARPQAADGRRVGARWSSSAPRRIRDQIAVHRARHRAPDRRQHAAGRRGRLRPRPRRRRGGRAGAVRPRHAGWSASTASRSTARRTRPTPT